MRLQHYISQTKVQNSKISFKKPESFAINLKTFMFFHPQVFKETGRLPNCNNYSN